MPTTQLPHDLVTSTANPVTLEQLGRRAKDKFPEYRDRYSDLELGQRIIDKYPEYSEIIKKPKVVDTFLQGHGFLKGLSDIVGTTGLGKGLAQGIFLKFTPEGKEVLNMIKRGELNQGDVESIIGKVATTKEVAGSAASIGLDVLLAGSLNAATKSFALTKAVAKPVAQTALGRIGKATLTGTGIGAAAGGISAFEQDKGLKDIIKQSLATGAIGGVLSGTVTAGVEGVKAVVSRSTAEKLMSATTRAKLEERRRAIKFGGDPVAKELLDEGFMGGDKQLLERSIDVIEKKGEELNKILAKNSKTITRKEIAPYLDSLIQEKLKTPGITKQADQIRAVLDDLPAVMTTAEANKIKQNIYSALRDTAWKLDPNLSATKEAMQKVALGIKDQIERKIPEEGIKIINKEMGKAIAIQDRMVDKLAFALGRKLGFFDIATGLGGGIAGGVLKGSPGLAIGAAAALGTKKLLESGSPIRAVAVGIDRTAKLLQNIPDQELGKLAKLLMFNALREGSKE